MSARSKTQERRVARFFGVERTPLSGGASRHTRSDTLHPDLYIEVKSAIGKGGSNGWLWRWLNRLTYPQDQIALPYNGDWLYLTHSDTIEPHAPYLVKSSQDLPAGCTRLWGGYTDKEGAWHKSVVGLAHDEKKVPLLALLVKGRRGFWIVGDAAGLLAAGRARKETLDEQELDEGRGEEAGESVRAGRDGAGCGGVSEKVGG